VPFTYYRRAAEPDTWSDRAAFPRHLAALPGWQGPGGRRSYSWLDQRLRAGQFMLPDGTTVQPRRTPGGYRRFTPAMLRDVALSSTRHGWFSIEKLMSTFRQLALAAYAETGESKIPS
jgi:hypothetical protein